MKGHPSVSPIQMQVYLSKDDSLSSDDLNMQYEMPACSQQILESGITKSVTYTIKDEDGKLGFFWNLKILR